LYTTSGLKVDTDEIRNHVGDQARSRSSGTATGINTHVYKRES
jgi:hypothetical protein